MNLGLLSVHGIILSCINMHASAYDFHALCAIMHNGLGPIVGIFLRAKRRSGALSKDKRSAPTSAPHLRSAQGDRQPEFQTHYLIEPQKSLGCFVQGALPSFGWAGATDAAAETPRCADQRPAPVANGVWVCVCLCVFVCVRMVLTRIHMALVYQPARPTR